MVFTHRIKSVLHSAQLFRYWKCTTYFFASHHFAVAQFTLEQSQHIFTSHGYIVESYYNRYWLDQCGDRCGTKYLKSK